MRRNLRTTATQTCVLLTAFIALYSAGRGGAQPVDGSSDLGGRMDVSLGVVDPDQPVSVESPRPITQSVQFNNNSTSGARFTIQYNSATAPADVKIEVFDLGPAGSPNSSRNLNVLAESFTLR